MFYNNSLRRCVLLLKSIVWIVILLFPGDYQEALALNSGIVFNIDSLYEGFIPYQAIYL